MFHKDLYLLHFFDLCPAHRNLLRSPLLHAVGLCEPWLGGVVRVAGVHSRTGAGGVSVMMSSPAPAAALAPGQCPASVLGAATIRRGVE